MRERILERVREALASREGVRHPGDFPGVPDAGDEPAVKRFHLRFTEAGGEVVRLASTSQAKDWLREYAGGFESAAVGRFVPPELTPDLPGADPDRASLGVSMARGAAASTASLLLESRGGRGPQILPPNHLVWVMEETIRQTMGALLEGVAPHASSALALHSGPSKSADIGQIMVTGVHGPGRIVAAILESQPERGSHSESKAGTAGTRERTVGAGLRWGRTSS